jgi:hypothetical protein
MKRDGRLPVNFVANFEVLDVRAYGFDNTGKILTSVKGNCGDIFWKWPARIFKSMGFTPAA